MPRIEKFPFSEFVLNVSNLFKSPRTLLRFMVSVTSLIMSSAIEDPVTRVKES